MKIQFIKSKRTCLPRWRGRWRTAPDEVDSRSLIGATNAIYKNTAPAASNQMAPSVFHSLLSPARLRLRRLSGGLYTAFPWSFSHFPRCFPRNLPAFPHFPHGFPHWKYKKNETVKYIRFTGSLVFPRFFRFNLRPKRRAKTAAPQ